MTTKRKIKFAAIGAVASVGVALSLLFASPADLFPSKRAADLPPAVVASAAAENEDSLLTDLLSSSEEDEKKGRRPLSARLRGFVLSLPLAVRALAALPLWALGWLITGALSLLWANVLSPAMGTVLSWAVFALLLLLAFIAVSRLMFPDVPLKKILCKRNILSLIFATALFIGCDHAVPLFWDSWDDVAIYARLAFSLLLLLWLTLSTALDVCRSRMAKNA